MLLAGRRVYTSCMSAILCDELQVLADEVPMKTLKHELTIFLNVIHLTDDHLVPLALSCNFSNDMPFDCLALSSGRLRVSSPT